MARKRKTCVATPAAPKPPSPLEVLDQMIAEFTEKAAISCIRSVRYPPKEFREFAKRDVRILDISECMAAKARVEMENDDTAETVVAKLDQWVLQLRSDAGKLAIRAVRNESPGMIDRANDDVSRVELAEIIMNELRKRLAPENP